MLWPLIKKYKGMFFSMIFISLLGFCILICLQSMIINVQNAYDDFKQDYGFPDITVTTSLFDNSKTDFLDDIDGIEEYNCRLATNIYMTAPQGNISTSVLTTHKDSDFASLYIDDESISSVLPNISVEKRYAQYNDLNVGDTVTLSLYGRSFQANVGQIFLSPDTIYAALSHYFLPDFADVGYIFMTEPEFIKAYNSLKLDNPDVFLLNSVGGFIYNDEIKSSNQIIVKIKDGYNAETVSKQIEQSLNEEDISVSLLMLGTDTPSYSYMEACLSSVTTAVIFLPIIFYIIMLMVIALFLNQIVMYMTNDIGIMSALGVSKGSIIKLLSVFALTVSAIAVAIGFFPAYWLSLFIKGAFEAAYSLPYVSASFDPVVTVLAASGTIGIGQVAVFLSSSRILKITPKDAMISNEAKKSTAAQKLDVFLNRTPIIFKLSTCFTLQNPRRLVISIFSIFASLLIVILACSFEISMNMVIDQTVNQRFQYGIQLYYSGDNGDKFFERLSILDCIDEIEEVYYADVDVEGYTEKETMVLEGIDPNSKLEYIPDETGTKRIYAQGTDIIMPSFRAQLINPPAEVGDILSINDRLYPLSNLSYQYANMKIFVTKDTFLDISDNYTRGFLVNANDEDELKQYLTTQKDVCLLIDSAASREDFTTRYDALHTMVFIIIGIGLSMAILIIMIMAQSSLMEQKRVISIMRALGYQVSHISKLFFIQILFGMIPGISIAIPVSIAIETFLFKNASATSSMFPVITNWLPYALCAAAVAGLVIVAHFLSIRIVSKWNIADNTRSRE